jgi:sugar O-acyltransferase (sialic acid O-acetyltransferase NeuD family)
MKHSIIIIGGFHEIIELAQDNNQDIYGLIDNVKIGSYLNYSILGSDNDIQKLYIKFGKHPILITPDNPLIRLSLYNLYSKNGFSFSSLISKDAKVSASANIGIGSIVQYGVKVSCESVVGRFVKLNYNCNIAHNVVIGDFTTIAPNAVVLGNVRVGRKCYIGANATILPNLSICDKTIIGAGAVVTKSISEAGSYIGIPAVGLVRQ